MITIFAAVSLTCGWREESDDEESGKGQCVCEGDWKGREGRGG